ncbi:MAG: hypothetical protein WB629_01740, partial [Candidatus Sulfotelmatobacter sp.]
IRGSAGNLLASLLSRPAFRPGRAIRAVGWVAARLYTLIFEMREDKEGEYYRFVTLWRSTRQEQHLYEQNT